MKTLSNALTDEILPDEFWHGVEQFNQQEFYACHDTLEALWIEATEPDKKFYQGILQVAVAFYHLGNQNWRGAVILLGEGINRLRGYQPTYATIDVEKFLTQSVHILTTLQQAGPDQVVAVMQQLGLLQPEPDLAEKQAERSANGAHASDDPVGAIAQPGTDPQLLTFPILQTVDQRQS
jgi:predicted metal-dependent hydrolase